jgi:hypothetical protein
MDVNVSTCELVVYDGALTRQGARMIIFRLDSSVPAGGRESLAEMGQSGEE